MRLARESIACRLKGEKCLEPAELGIVLTDAMKQKRAAFVTLRKACALRGCIGEILPRRRLYESVMYNAVNAAVNDRRFTPVSADELDSITIEISALTVPEPVSSPGQIKIGADGIVLEKDGLSAVFLPQVAHEQGWSLEETLTHLSIKAGLYADAWRQGAAFMVFQAEVFSERQ